MRLRLLAIPLLLAASSPSFAGTRCVQETLGRSLEGKVPALLGFANRSGQERRIYWLDYQGERKLYKKLAPGQSLMQRTFLTHPWVVTDAHDDCLGVYLPGATPRTEQLR